MLHVVTLWDASTVVKRYGFSRAIVPIWLHAVVLYRGRRMSTKAAILFHVAMRDHKEGETGISLTKTPKNYVGHIILIRTKMEVR